MKTVNGVATAALVVIAVALVAIVLAGRTVVQCPGIGMPASNVCVATDRWTGAVEYVRVSADRVRAELAAEREAEREAAWEALSPEMRDAIREWSAEVAQAQGSR